MSQEHVALVVECLAYGAGAVLDPGIEVGVDPGLEERLADVADGALDATLLVAAGDGDMRREIQQHGVEPDRVAVALDDGALEVVEEQHARDAVKFGERLDVPTHEEGHRRAREEAQEDPARVAEHHDEGPER
ncbi:hypothetical protein BE20_04515 [Sorangium cellulosum]|nr:hypothetical protein BE20_04515 [Sorangium cellulosum]